MAKEKVYKLAQEFKVSSEALVQLLRTMGIPVKSHMSTVDETLRDEIKRKFETERAEIKKEYDRKKLLLAKKREESAPVPEKKEEPPKQETHAPAANGAPASQPHTPHPHSPHSSSGPVPSPQPYRPSFAPPSNQPQAAPGAPRPAYEGSRPIRRTSQTYDSSSLRVGFINGPVAAVASTVTSERPEKSAEGTNSFHKGKKKGNKKKTTRPEVDAFELKNNVKKTLAKIGAGSTRKKYKKDSSAPDEEDTEEKKNLNVSEFVTAAEFANMIQQPIAQVIAKCLELGLFVTINHRLDFETIELLADEFGFAASLMDEYAAEEEEPSTEENIGTLEPRAPIVTIMGHVDHGKTSLLDYVRKTNVIAGEAGGITQHIAAYEIHTPRGPVTFLDTPGHEAFTAMRARGSQVTDVIVLVVAADSGVMPQTKEAIDHARAANVPIVVAINKIDLPVANPEKVKSELANFGVVVEEYGGHVACVEISARTGLGMDKLLERLALETEMLELKASKSGTASGVIVESELDKGKGSIATVLIQKGTLRKGDSFITGIHFGRVRDLYNERGQSVDSAGPSQPVVVLGLSGTPQAGDSFKVVGEEKDAREISARRRLAQKEREMRRIGSVSLDHLYEQIKAGKVQSLNLIIKGDVDGSVEALAEACSKFSNEEIRVNVIHKSVGAIKEADIMLAAASKAIIIGFHLSPNTKIRELARREGVDIRTFRIIYEAIDAIKKSMEGMLAPEIKENITATVEIRAVFKITKVGMVAGCMVQSGTVHRGSKARLIREDIEIIDTKIGTLRREKDDAREVAAGYECGITLDQFTDYKEGDRIEVYEEVKIARKLS